MNDKFAIKLIRHKKTIGAFSYYGFKNIHFVLSNLIIPMVVNYNIRLINSSLDDPLFAIRFLEQENEDATKIGPPFKPVIKDESKIYIEKKYPDFDLSKTYGGFDTGFISITDGDIKEALNAATFMIVIDLDTNRVRMYDFYEKIEVARYEDLTGEKTDDLKECPYDSSNLPFNQLSDFYDFVWDNYYYFNEGRHEMVAALVI